MISPEKGLVAFGLLEEEYVSPDFSAKQEETYYFIERRLKSIGEFFKNHQLLIDINIVTFAPNVKNDLPTEEDYPLCNEETLGMTLSSIKLNRPELYDQLSLMIRTIEKPRQTIAERKTLKLDSKGAYCANLEKSHALVLDQNQIRAVTETVEGVQCMRGLSGSGKSTVLALKAAYIHACHPDWKIGVTFSTRSARSDYLTAIEYFYNDQTGRNVNWENIKVCQAWGAAKGKNEDEGMYSIFTSINHLVHYEYTDAKRELGWFDPFGDACERAILDYNNKSKEIFDVMLVDEAHDFPAHFLRMCYVMLKSPKRLVFTYDELQNFRTQSVQPPETYFSNGDNGMPAISLYLSVGYERVARIVLDGCYERPPVILSAAHALAFGIYREPPLGEVSLTQMFDNIQIWNDLGYELLDGRLDYGERVVIGRRPAIPKQPDIDDQIVFRSFKSKESLDNWVVEEVKKNLADDELRAQDILIIVPEVLSFFASISAIKNKLDKEMIKCHVVGKDTPQYKFWNGESIAICNLYQARSHEAAMVYVIDANTSWHSKYEMTLIRNQLYSAMTRSKTWVRVVGAGKDMDLLVEEYERAKSKDFKFDFVYPKKEQLSGLRMAFREHREFPLASDIFFLQAMVGQTLEMIMEGKVELNLEQFRLLKSWFNNSTENWYIMGNREYYSNIGEEDEDEDEGWDDEDEEEEDEDEDEEDEVDPKRVLEEALELIKQGKIDLDEEQKRFLRDWLDRKAM
ncbi:MAG: ATP-binding domain-containing protein [Clostridiales bacterium]|nr:ATP-binding domain-containing protein [Clostridiales bacterium]